MKLCCDLEVDVNGEETFLLDKNIISSFSGRLRNLFGKSNPSTRNYKVIFNDFPGGAESFELMARFCYNNGTTEITPFNVSFLHCAAHFMEMNKSNSGGQNLIEQTEKSLEDISYWTWSELLVALKQCQESLAVASSSGILQKCMDSLVGRQVFTFEANSCPSTSSPDSSGFRLSSDTRSTESLKTGFSRVNWWFEDLIFLNPNLIEMLIKSMVSRKLDHSIISRFLFYYHKSKYVTVTSEDKSKITETVIDMLYLLDWSFVPCKNLFGILRAAQSSNIDKCCRIKLESMIGSQMDQATLDNLLVPSPSGMNYLYDVNLVLRFLKSFLHGGGISQVSSIRLRRVARLMDMYLAEVAPDPCLKPLKFLALATALPESARESDDGIYHAVDMFLEVHAGLSEEEKSKICDALNYKKLSAETYFHLSQNPKFPPKTAAQALTTQQCKLKSLLQDIPPSSPLTDSPCSFTEIGLKGNKDELIDQIVLYAGKPMNLFTDNEKLKSHLQGMQWRVIELEKICKKMQTQMAKIMKSKSTSHGNTRSLPKLCS